MTSPALTDPDKNLVAKISPGLLPWLGFFGGIMMWLIDVAVDTLIINPEHVFWQEIIHEDMTEMWMRSMVVLVFTAGGFLGRYLLIKEKRIEQELIRYQHHLEDLVRERTSELEQLANTDHLTKLYNRRKFIEQAERELKHAQQDKYPVSVMLCDIDHFKSINDKFGHDVGDSVLVGFAQCLKTSLEQKGIFARWGGEEFIVLLPRLTAAEAQHVAESLRTTLTSCCDPGCVRVTASFGVTEWHEKEDYDDMIRRTDEALYRAKGAGRDQVCIIH